MFYSTGYLFEYRLLTRPDCLITECSKLHDYSMLLIFCGNLTALLPTITLIAALCHLQKLQTVIEEDPNTCTVYMHWLLVALALPSFCFIDIISGRPLSSFLTTIAFQFVALQQLIICAIYCRTVYLYRTLVSAHKIRVEFNNDDSYLSSSLESSLNSRRFNDDCESTAHQPTLGCFDTVRASEVRASEVRASEVEVKNTVVS